MKVLVVGAGGYIGQRVCRRLQADGHCVVRSSSGDGTGLDPISGRPGPRFRLPGGTAGVIYLAQSPYGGEMPARATAYFAANALSALEIAGRAAEAGVPRFLFASSGSVYVPSREPLTETAPVRRDEWYVLSKLYAEELLALCDGGMSVLSCRLFGVYGPGQTGRLVPNIIKRVKSGQPVDLQPAAQEDGHSTDGLRLSLLYIDDLARIMAQLLVSDIEGVLNVASPESMGVRQIADAVADALGTKAHFRVLDQHRLGDFVADIGRLQALLAPTFTPFSAGLDAVLREHRGS